MQPALRWTLRLAAKYGDTFRLRVLGPRHRSEPSWRSMVPRTVVIVSSPSHLREVFLRSGDELRSGEAREFIAWHMGSDAIAVLDGAAHRAERQALGGFLRRTTTPEFEGRLRTAIQQGFAGWPDQGTVSLGPRIERVGLEAILTGLFGPLGTEAMAQLCRLVDHGAITTTVSPQTMVLPILQTDFGPWSPGGRLRRTVDKFEAFVLSRLAVADGGLVRESREELSHREGSSEFDTALLVQRVRTLLAGWQPTATTLVWLCYHVLRDVAIRDRVVEAARSESLEGRKFLDAVCLETLRLNLPFLGAFRRVSSPTTFGGIAWQEGTLILPALLLTHRRSDLFADPAEFRPERFLSRRPSSCEYAPFGGGVRYCLGDQLALVQMRVVLTELLRAFDIEPVGQWSNHEMRRGTMLVARDPLKVRVRRRESRSWSPLSAK